MATTDFTPAKHDLSLYRGDSVELPLRFGSADVDGNFDVGYDLTGVSFVAQIRTLEDDEDILATFAVDIADQSDPDTKGLVTLSLTPDQTDELDGRAKWDVQATWPGDVVRTYIAGQVRIKKDVSRA